MIIARHHSGPSIWTVNPIPADPIAPISRKAPREARPSFRLMPQ
jgi:hypothetical protein